LIAWKKKAWYLSPTTATWEGEKKTMPAEIVPDTCPAPPCNLNEQDIASFLDEMRDSIALFAPAFQGPEQLGRSETYVRGLQGDAVRKNIE
jgi:hypothetical protein